ncbi:MAG: hypothetical protein PHF86_10680 [Candidatus Nanoarchaeia archaeon]|nr:hypothetical protein [Candidatus Nanoarchaeia archaeon]
MKNNINCYKCKNSKLKSKKSFIILNNIFVETDKLECKKCGETYSTIDETERVRKILYAK